MQHAERLTLAEMREFLAASNTLSFAGGGVGVDGQGVRCESSFVSRES